MSRRRYVSTEISLDEAVDGLAQQSDFAALLYTWMIPHASDDATITGDARRLLAMVMPYRRDKTPEDVGRALDLMESLGLFELRTPKTIYFEPEKFYRYQSYIQAKNRRVLAAIAIECRKTPENTASLSPSLSPSHTHSLSPSPSPSRPVDNSEACVQLAPGMSEDGLTTDEIRSSIRLSLGEARA